MRWKVISFIGGVNRDFETRIEAEAFAKEMETEYGIMCDIVKL